MSILEIFINRLAKIGIEVKLASNIPWVYIVRINGHAVTERFQGNHGFTVAFYRFHKDQKDAFTDITEIFKLIRKYISYPKTNEE